ncbi:MAG: 2-C-methyl-D-erythritol 2,4-cyclodiphosphate synthase [Solirubrobacterales bacterium]|nr:2-C-methyl-D-erythritol 2,4-cyclodiphosphate synthase [Solirubrobacterales bacterium]
MSGATRTRSGIGWDSHRFKAGRPLILGGVEFDGAQFGLDGHSDADVLTHAVMDALLGAAGLDDIGVHFPDSDGAYKDADSIALLRDVVAAAATAGWRVVHVDTTMLMERPKLGPYRTAIRESLAGALGLAVGDVNVKASTGEGMGFVGRLEGAAALAVATVESIADPAISERTRQLAAPRPRRAPARTRPGA